MATDTIVLDVNKVAKDCTLNVKIVGIKRFKGRLWLAGRLIKLAATIAGLYVKFEEKPWYSPDI